MARMMRLIWNIKEKMKYNGRGKSDHDRYGGCHISQIDIQPLL